MKITIRNIVKTELELGTHIHNQRPRVFDSFLHRYIRVNLKERKVKICILRKLLKFDKVFVKILKNILQKNKKFKNLTVIFLVQVRIISSEI